MTRRGDGLPPRLRDRGQSVAINYTFSLIIVALLMSGLFIAMSGFLETERENVTRAEFEVLGNRIAADISTADRLARTTTGDAQVQVRTKIPQMVAGSEYDVTITSSPAPGGGYDVAIELWASEVSVGKNVSTRTQLEVTSSSLDGGKYVISSDGTTIEVDDD